MSDLQIGLIALGVLLIAIVLGLNWWQDRRVRERMEENFPQSREDPLLGGAALPARGKPGSAPAERREPGWAEATQKAMPPPSGVRVEPLVAGAADGDDADEPDPACEAVIDVVFVEPVAAEDLLPLVRDIHRAGQKPLRVFFRTAQGVHCAQMRLGEQYVSMHVAVLLANRSGALTVTEWAQAWAQAQHVADQFEAEIEGPDPKEISQHAKALDALCASLDTSVGLTLVARGPRPWRAAEVLSCARGVGFIETADADRLDWPDDDGRVRFSLTYPAADGRGASPSAAARISLLLDVPRSPASETAFADMAEVARLLANKLDADVVDDNGSPLATGSEAAVDTQLRGLYADLDKHGLTAGSARALKVFA